ncbi:Scm-Like With Four Mbt Domains Protein 1 [Manis pentadactyla]|nr:Scm-Like With Four Mbt Domains Protein 1 [Manis pentadactyla]
MATCDRKGEEEEREQPEGYRDNTDDGRGGWQQARRLRITAATTSMVLTGKPPGWRRRGGRGSRHCLLIIIPGQRSTWQAKKTALNISSSSIYSKGERRTGWKLTACWILHRK